MCKNNRYRNFISFLVESKPHERIVILIAARVNIYQTKESSEGKLPKQFKNLAFLRESLPLYYVTPLFLSNIFMTSLLFQI